MSMVAAQFLAKIDRSVQDYPDTLVVQVHRRLDPAQFGWHVLSPIDVPMSHPFYRSTLGLVDEETNRHVRAALLIKRGMDELHHLDRFTVAPGVTLLVYLIEQIVPIEWQQRMLAGDSELLDRIKVYATTNATRHGNWALSLVVDK